MTSAPAFPLTADDGSLDAQASRELAELLHCLLAIVHDQARQLQATKAELQAARTALDERKVIERAKGLLMAHRQLSEHDAYRVLRRMAMNQKRRVAEVAQSVLDMAEVLPALGIDAPVRCKAPSFPRRRG